MTTVGTGINPRVSLMIRNTLAYGSELHTELSNQWFIKLLATMVRLLLVAMYQPLNHCTVMQIKQRLDSNNWIIQSRGVLVIIEIP